MSGLEEKPFASTGKIRKKEIWVLGFGFGREESWVVWKRKVLGLEEKLFVGTGKRRKKEIKKNKIF